MYVSINVCINACTHISKNVYFMYLGFNVYDCVLFYLCKYIYKYPLFLYVLKYLSISNIMYVYMH